MRGSTVPSATSGTANVRRQVAGRTSRLLLAAMFAVTGTAHVLSPAVFEHIVPDWLPGPPGLYNGAATAAELTTAALLSSRRTGRAGGWMALATLAGVWVANVGVAVDGGYDGLAPPWDSALVAWIRVPLQIPLLWWAWAVARGPRRPRR